MRAGKTRELPAETAADYTFLTLRSSGAHRDADTLRAMRRTALVIMLCALLAPAAAWATPRVLGDGTLSVRNGDGSVRLDLDRGVVIGRLGKGTVELVGSADPGCTSALVWDDGEQIVGEIDTRTTVDGDVVVRCTYAGQNLRFRLLGSDAATIRLIGENISLSAVGRGRGQVKGQSSLLNPKRALTDGTWSVNGEDYVSLPDDAQRFTLQAPVPPPE